MIKDLIREARRESVTRGVTTPAMSCAEVLQGLYDTHYTGRIVLDLKEGRIAVVNIPSDIQIRVE